MSTIKVLINGAKGKMGAISAATIAQHPNFTLSACCDKEDNLSETILKSQPDVVLDFTTPDSVLQNCLTIIEHRICPVIGTTGLQEQDIIALKKQCVEQELGGLIVPNFSLGANLMMKMSSLAAQYYNHVEITETHHEKKLDAPSGTALHTASLIKKAHEANQHTSNAQCVSTEPRGHSYHNIPIHSLRLPGRLAHQTVIFGANGETLTIQHDTTDRQCFMPGIILACQKVINMKELKIGLYSILS